MIERIYSGVIGGTRFRYSIPVNLGKSDDLTFKAHVRDDADRRLGLRLLQDLIARGVIEVREEPWEW